MLGCPLTLWCPTSGGNCGPAVEAGCGCCYGNAIDSNAVVVAMSFLVITSGFLWFNQPPPPHPPTHIHLASDLCHFVLNPFGFVRLLRETPNLHLFSQPSQRKLTCLPAFPALNPPPHPPPPLPTSEHSLLACLVPLTPI